MHLTGIQLGGVPPFTKSIELKFDERVNVFTGPNASGKSTILREINDQLSLRRSGAIIDTSPDWPRQEISEINIPPKETAVPFQYILATRINLPPVPFDWAKEKPMGFPEDGFDDTPLEALSYANSRAFDATYVESAINSFQVVTWDQGRDQFGKAVMLGYACAKSICAEVIRDYAPHPFVEEVFPSGKIIVHPGMGIGTVDAWFENPEELYAGVLSAGTQGTLFWIWALSLKIANYYDFRVGWEQRPAILLIDEIENHLHPTWQRRVIPALMEHFPGLQIFATTHSPFVVAGLNAGQVHLLQRDDDGEVTASTNERDVIGWTADEILRTLMGVDEPTDQLTVDRANELRELRRKESRTPEQESRLQELRRQVNRDLLSKVGPLEAEQERFDDWIQNFLRSRQSDLTQDGE